VEDRPRQVLKRVIALYREQGWEPWWRPNSSSTWSSVTPTGLSLEPPIGRSGRAEAGRRSYSISAVNEFEDVFEDIYAFAEAQHLEVDTPDPRGGGGADGDQLRHGDPLLLADQCFLLKRTIREAALAHDIYATFMAKPIANEPGSAMHIHQSVVSAETGGKHLHRRQGQADAGVLPLSWPASQRYVPPVTWHAGALRQFLPAVVKSASAPVNVLWGYDTAPRPAHSPLPAAARRVENRVLLRRQPLSGPGRLVACGYLGLTRRLTPASGFRHRPLRRVRPAGRPARGGGPVRGDRGTGGSLRPALLTTFAAVKRAEFATFMR